MIQVFRVFKRSTPETYFVAVSMLNRYLREAETQGDPIQTNDLYIVGLATVFIASKFEDKLPITLDELYRDAGHKNFSKELICEAKKEIL
jgi:hypothetical protein